MIQFLITAAIVLVFVFILVLLGSGMLWVVVKVLRFLFPQRFGPKAVPAKKPKKAKKVVAEDEAEEV